MTSTRRTATRRTTPSTPRDGVVVSRTLPLPAAAAWDLVADPRNHPRWIPLTRVEVRGVPLAAGSRVVGITGPTARRGGTGLVDRMVVDRFDAPTDRADGVCELRKVGPVLLGTAGVRVTPLGHATSRVTWTEDVHLAGPLPRAVTRAALAPALAAMVRLALWRAAREVSDRHRAMNRRRGG
ncbi:SRPBCC family protein [Cellulomonas fimi]|uniref:SRPBCC family protein n=1 Tax=Cellulomonas fimi TaxID=1708 RepID=A0A7Y0QGU8_CELFI|nr:SRPBCC family protein [Cellulomonas fimi]NMR20491.1 SRPBCC family protein [Cellulomonas fimi]